jgi:hypothetical protein
LENEAQDWDIACKIRSYVAEIEERRNSDEKTRHWLKWAKEKADWYDPTIARRDEYLGQRDHKQNSDMKGLKKSWY